MGRSVKYEDPPIEEAVCEFRFSEDTPWDLTVPGLLFEQIRETFPNRERRVLQQVRFAQGDSSTTQNLEITELVVLLSADRKTLVQIGPHLLSVNRLRPYQGWGEYRPGIQLAYDAVLRVVEVTALKRIGLRYVNRVRVPEAETELSRYFEFRPFIRDQLPQSAHSFMVGCEFPYRDGADMCRVQLATAAPPGPGLSGYVLDLDYYLAQPVGVKPCDAMQWVEAAHVEVRNVFEGCITDELRALFGEVT